jgi:hypothetical protein
MIALLLGKELRQIASEARLFLLLNYPDTRMVLSQMAKRIGSGPLLVIQAAYYLYVDRSFYINKTAFVEGSGDRWK